MNKKFVIQIFCFLFFLSSVTSIFAQASGEGSYFRARVMKIIEEKKMNEQDSVFYTQRIEVKRLDTNQLAEIAVGTEFQPLNQNQLVKVGSTIIVTEQKKPDNTTELVVVDIYRTPAVVWLLGGFFLLVIFVAGLQGLMSIIGMVISLAILSMFIVPHILLGENPIVVTLIGATGIAALTIYLSHGFSLKSHISLFSMMSVLAVVAILSQVSVKTAQIVGLGTEEAYYLQFGQTSKINLQGLLLGGILLGALGVLDDICVSQVSIVFEMKALKKDTTFPELFDHALQVGKDHVASLVNTLVLAYAGANLPLFILFSINNQIPHWVTLNSEIILEEVIRTLTGSIGLVLSVPLSTLIAAYISEKLPVKFFESPRKKHSKHNH